MNKIVFLCHVSNPNVRSMIQLYRYPIRRFFYRITGGKTIYEDFAIWVSDYITEFEKHNEFEFHIVAPHWGMKKNRQDYKQNGVFYHFFKCNKGIINTYLDKKFHIQEKNDYSENRKKIGKIINEINPNLVILCGAENPYYGLAVLDIKDKPVYVILQTLLNDPKRIEAGLGSSYKRKKELEIFQSAKYYATSGNKTMELICSINPSAVFLPVRFPSHRPDVKIPDRKEFDFVFFAATVSINKGIEDLIRAVYFVKQTIPNVRINVIGSCKSDYKKHLDNLISELELWDNVFFAGFYQQISESYLNVVKAKSVVVPGTTSVNSTVRESMYMGLPTIVYDLPAIKKINADSQCLFVAPVGDIKELAMKMVYVMQNPEVATQVAANGKAYAEKYFSNASIVNELLLNSSRIISGEF